MPRRNSTRRRPQTGKANPERIARVQELRRSNAATVIPSGKTYNRKNGWGE